MIFICFSWTDALSSVSGFVNLSPKEIYFIAVIIIFGALMFCVKTFPFSVDIKLNKNKISNVLILILQFYSGRMLPSFPPEILYQNWQEPLLFHFHQPHNHISFP
jgi:purine-cytosine permease-like protein